MLLRRYDNTLLDDFVVIPICHGFTTKNQSSNISTGSQRDTFEFEANLLRFLYVSRLYFIRDVSYCTICDAFVVAIAHEDD